MKRRTRQARRSNRGRWAILPLAALLLLPLTVGVGCNSGGDPTAPGPGAGVTIEFLPASAVVDIPCGRFREFQISIQGSDYGNPVWRSADGQTGIGPRFRYFSTKWQPDTLWAEVVVNDVRHRREWLIGTVPGQTDAGFMPRETDLRVLYGMEQAFEARMACEPLGVDWFVGDEAVGDGSLHVFEATRSGRYAVSAKVTLPDTTVTRTWSLLVALPGEDFLYDPAGTNLQMYETQARTFTVTSTSPLPEVVWLLDGDPAGTGASYDFVATAAGDFQVTASIDMADTTINRIWNLEVFAADTGPPSPVTDLVVSRGERLGQTVCTWSAVNQGIFPLVAYELRCSTDGPVTANNWHLAQPVGAGSWLPDRSWFEVAVWNDDQGWATDQDVCFGVRALDELGVWSELVDSPCQIMDRDWWLEGTVTGPDGTPAPDALVTDLRSGAEVTTDDAGAYTIGPFAPRDTVQLQATGFDPVSGYDWSPLTSVKIAADDPGRQDFRLIPSYGTDPTCPMYRDSFQRYFRMMTKTNYELLNKPNYELYRWDTFPVDVYIPDWVSPLDIDYGTAAREAIAIWNASMGEEYLRLVDTPPEYGIFFRFEVADEGFHGRSVLLQPGDGLYTLATRIPEQIMVELAPDLRESVFVTEISLHELGHCLGLYSHATCIETEYLMNHTSAGALDNGPDEAIHQDERNAIRLIRQLPQRTDMSVYPWY